MIYVYLTCFQLYSWGGGACLGCGSPEAVSFKPRLVEDLQSTHIVDMSCGDSHCLALTHGKIKCVNPIIEKHLTEFVLSVTMEKCICEVMWTVSFFDLIQK